jgi:hypothetical protein
MAVRWWVPMWAAGFWVVAGPALACINATELLEPEVERVALAERLLSTGRAAQAFVTSHASAFELRNAHSELRRDTRYRLLFERSKQVMAVAVVRLEGRVDLDRGRNDRKAPPERRTANLAWAERTLVSAFENTGAPIEDAHLAEVLALDDERWQEARTRLRALVERDLMPDAFAWSTLAKLEARAGAEAETRHAHEQCRKRAGRLSRRICGKPPALVS